MSESFVLKEFNPDDPFCVMSDTFRREVMGIAIRGLKTTLFRELDREQQIQCLVSGILTGLLLVCLTGGIKREHADEMVAYIAKSLPAVLTSVESILDARPEIA